MEFFTAQNIAPEGKHSSKRIHRKKIVDIFEWLFYQSVVKTRKYQIIQFTNIGKTKYRHKNAYIFGLRNACKPFDQVICMCDSLGVKNKLNYT